MPPTHAHDNRILLPDPAGPSTDATYHFWSDEHNLFYRDDRYLNSTVFWGRGNGWAMGALVSALQHSPPNDPHRAVYQDLFEKHAASLKAIQSSDGCWGASLLNSSGYPPPETTGSSSFAYGIAYGINSGILSSADYLPVVESAWSCLNGIALQPSGLFGYCQPVGGSPEHNVSPNSTSDFCVGLFTLAATEVAKLAEHSTL
jgi:rhamnogalacturonyl hydrolase YesR